MNRLKYIFCLIILGSVLIALNAAVSIDFFKPEPYQLTYPNYFGNRYLIPNDNPTTVEGVSLGRMLFYEKALSAGNKISCGSCHRQELAFTDGKDFSQGADGTPQPRNTMALVNLLWTRNLFWDGRAKLLEVQVKEPLLNIHEMNQPIAISIRKLEALGIYSEKFGRAFGDTKITEDRIAKALAQFERTLISADSKYDRYLQGKYQPTASEVNGIALFYGRPNAQGNIRSAACSHCHGGPQTYSELYMNNGLDSVYKDPGREAITGQDYDKGRFRTVTLRNIALTAPYMHDARFKTLEEVVDHYSDHLVKSKYLSPFLQNLSGGTANSQMNLTINEKKDLIAFLHMLTDSTFIQDRRFSDPFEKGNNYKKVNFK